MITSHVATTPIAKAMPTAPVDRPSRALISSLNDTLGNIVRNSAPIGSSLTKYPTGPLSSSNSFNLDRLRNESSIASMYMAKCNELRLELDRTFGSASSPDAIRKELVFLDANATRMGGVSGFLEAVVGYREIRNGSDLATRARFADSVADSAQRALDAMRQFGWR